MEVMVDNSVRELKKTNRKVGSEAPALRVMMLNGEVKVIGMMADKVQVIITLANSYDLTESLLSVINKYSDKSYIYIMTSKELDTKYDDFMTSIDIKNLTLKYGVNIEDNLCAKSIFIISKDGEIEYKETLDNLIGEFNIELFDKELNKAINFKKKGHTHENWMSV